MIDWRSFTIGFTCGRIGMLDALKIHPPFIYIKHPSIAEELQSYDIVCSPEEEAAIDKFAAYQAHIQRKKDGDAE